MPSCLSQPRNPVGLNPDPARILVADDEETFRETTVDLLLEEGFCCEGANDSFSAVQMLRDGRYDLLIADINMPGNANLELVQQMHDLDSTVPVILVTGYPSVRSAVASLRLPVAAYLIKPLDFSDLLEEVGLWLKRRRILRTAHDMQRLLGQWREELEGLQIALRETIGSGSAMALLALAMRQVTTALRQVFQIARNLPQLDRENLQTIPAQALLAGARDLLEETVDTLEATKTAFKSKQLGRLRHRLQVAIDQWESLQDSPSETPGK